MQIRAGQFNPAFSGVWVLRCCTSGGFADGQVALRFIRSQRVDIVLSDWNMPVMTGLELLKTLRADPRTANMPFLMVTAEAERPRIEAAIQAGVSAMLIKPYSPNQLAARLEKALTTQAPRP